MVRSFVAVRLADRIIERLRAGVDRSIRGIRWVDPENLHLTLKFLGEVEEDRLKVLQDGLGRIACAPFDLTVEGTGSFPERGPPRVIWVGCAGPAAPLAEAVERTCVSHGFPKEDRPFRQHITIGRVKDRRAGKDVRLDPKAMFGTQRVESFTLVKSDLSPTGAIYTDLATFPLSAIS